MATPLQTIQHIRSLRKENRNPRLPAATLKSVEVIQQCLQSGTDQNGWRKVEWRSARPSSSSGHASGHSSSSRYTTHATHSSHSGHSNHSGHPSYGSSQRHKSTYSRPSTSIPLAAPHSVSFAPVASLTASSLASAPTSSASLTAATASVAATSSSSASSASSEDTFEVVRRGRRCDRGDHHEFRAPPAKYVSKFKRTSEKVEDTILNTILLGKLNKFSASNYQDIKEFIIQIIDDGQTEMITCFMKLLFEKAASEEIFCPLYAKLLSELSVQYPILLTEMANLYTKYMVIFVEVATGADETYQELCERNLQRKYRRGYSQFLAELVKHNVMDHATFIQSMINIVEQVERNQNQAESVKVLEEYADCLMKMLKALSDSEKEDEEKEKEQILRASVKEAVMERIQPLTQRRPDAAGLSNKARFTFMDLYDELKKW